MAADLGARLRKGRELALEGEADRRKPGLGECSRVQELICGQCRYHGRRQDVHRETPIEAMLRRRALQRLARSIATFAACGCKLRQGPLVSGPQRESRPILRRKAKSMRLGWWSAAVRLFASSTIAGAGFRSDTQAPEEHLLPLSAKACLESKHRLLAQAEWPGCERAAAAGILTGLDRLVIGGLKIGCLPRDIAADRIGVLRDAAAGRRTARSRIVWNEARRGLGSGRTPIACCRGNSGLESIRPIAIHRIMPPGGCRGLRLIQFPGVEVNSIKLASVGGHHRQFSCDTPLRPP
jgi:hypothetical protein